MFVQFVLGSVVIVTILLAATAAAGIVCNVISLAREQE